jgi:hypothetical protein
MFPGWISLRVKRPKTAGKWYTETSRPRSSWLRLGTVSHKRSTSDRGMAYFAGRSVEHPAIAIHFHH